ncbi:MAG TPA: amidohydrolase family protein [Bryobacteraceae bacterium]|nr:amidohydrolase family protein [Bryobacteraceae bacterium]
MTRRSLLAAAAVGSTLVRAQENPIPIIDTHFHLYDQTRPQGAPFPFTPSAPPFLPRDYRESAKPLGIVGGIEVEASPWVEDNLWVLMQIEQEPMIVGTVGNIDPAKCDFQDFLERYHRNKLFLGIRYGNVWKGQDLVTAINKPDFIENMKIFARTGLTLEVANPRLDLIEATLRLSDKAPDLRIVLGHLQALPLPSEPGVLKSYTNNLRELRKRRAFAKVSGLPKANPQAAFDPAVYKPTLDLIWGVFGEDYVVYAGKNKEALDILKAYTMAMGRPAAEKFFWKNSIPAFRWIKRDAEQPQLG